MEKEFIPYELAVKLKSLEFNEPCFGFYSNGELIYNTFTNNEMQRFRYAAPTFSQAFRWFRENYRLDGKPEYFLNNFYCFIINDMKQEDTSRRLFTEFPSYEEAELACLEKLIEIVELKSE